MLMRNYNSHYNALGSQHGRGSECIIAGWLDSDREGKISIMNNSSLPVSLLLFSINTRTIKVNEV